MLKSIKNSLVLTSVLYVVLGLVLIFFPNNSLNLACGLIGLVTLGYGIVRIVAYLKDGGSFGNRFDMFIGIVLAALGVFLLICPQVIVSLIPIALGIYILVDSISAIKKALDMKTLGYDKWWISFLIALVLAAFGGVMILSPFSAVSTLVVFIGVGFVFDGVFTLANTIVADKILK